MQPLSGALSLKIRRTKLINWFKENHCFGDYHDPASINQIQLIVEVGNLFFDAIKVSGEQLGSWRANESTCDRRYESSGGSVYSRSYNNIRLDLDDIADLNLFQNVKRLQFKLNIQNLSP